MRSIKVREAKERINTTKDSGTIDEEDEDDDESEVSDDQASNKAVDGHDDDDDDDDEYTDYDNDFDEDDYDSSHELEKLVDSKESVLIDGHLPGNGAQKAKLAWCKQKKSNTSRLGKFFRRLFGSCIARNDN